MTLPKWTVLTNLVSPESTHWVGKSYEFFDDENLARICFDRHHMLGNCSTKRPFHENDRRYLHPMQGGTEK